MSDHKTEQLGSKTPDGFTIFLSLLILAGVAAENVGENELITQEAIANYYLLIIVFLKKNGIKAVDVFRKFAEQDVLAQYNLGYCYGNGLGISKDEKKAHRYFEEAAKQGNIAAQNQLGQSHLMHRGDAKTAVNFFDQQQSKGFQELTPIWASAT